MRIPIDDEEVENRPVGRGELLHISYQFLIYDLLIGMLGMIGYFPHIIGETADFGDHVVFPQLVDGRVDHDPPDPSHQHPFDVNRVSAFELGEVGEELYVTVVDDVYRFLVAIDVPEDGFQSISIIMLIYHPLILMLASFAALDYVIYVFQSGLGIAPAVRYEGR